MIDDRQTLLFVTDNTQREEADVIGPGCDVEIDRNRTDVTGDGIGWRIRDDFDVFVETARTTSRRARMR